jgi:hypothetical protein
MEIINVVCVLSQNKNGIYDSSWVKKLHNAISRNLTIPHRFICLSNCDVECERIFLDDTGDGFWTKLQLFKPGNIVGPTLYLDLDTVICQNIDEIIERVYNEKFVMWYEADVGVHSSAMLWWNGDFSFLWDLYMSQPLEHWKELYKNPPLYGDQALISENVDHSLFTDFLPSDWFRIATKKDHKIKIPNIEQIKILHFRSTGIKPNLFPTHPLISKHWI